MLPTASLDHWGPMTETPLGNPPQENANLQTALEKEKNDLRDINEILTSELKVANVVCENLEKRKAELEDILAALQAELKSTVERMQRERDETVSRLEDQIEGYKGQLKGLDEFIKQKTDLEGELAQVKETLARERKDSESKISDLERAHVQVRRRPTLVQHPPRPRWIAADALPPACRSGSAGRRSWLPRSRRPRHRCCGSRTSSSKSQPSAPSWRTS